MELLEHLRKRQADGRPIRVGLVGCGQEGSGMVHVTRQMAGLETFAIADNDLTRPLRTLRSLGIPDSSICVTDQGGAAEDALEALVVQVDALEEQQGEEEPALVPREPLGQA